MVEGMGNGLPSPLSTFEKKQPERDLAVYKTYLAEKEQA